MIDTTNRSLPRVRHPVHALLAPVPLVCFPGALLTDVAYARSADMQWANFSAWLLFFGIVFAGLAAVAGAVDFVGSGHGVAWPQVAGTAVVLVLALFDNLVHSRDAWTSVVPTGVVLSGLTVLAMIATALAGHLPRRSVR